MKKKPLILIKYGGNAMLSERLKQSVVQNIWKLWSKGYRIVLVHGGGPFIKKMLELVKIESEFIEGHRKTPAEALKYIEMALKGEVNGSLVSLLNKSGLKAVGLSGKDGRMALARKRYHVTVQNGKEVQYDLGQVGDVEQVDTTLLHTLLENGYLPVVACIASDEAGNDYNINADMFAGSLAGALKANHYLVLTDVDGLLRDIDDSSSIIRKLRLEELKPLLGSVIKGGMIPKMESCELALRQGARSACIINGTKPESIFEAVNTEKTIGTEICL
ncbi:MAG: acetylglutamate kinase [Lewinellaceae bacterium]|nr:acetylglutamate kinase [Phaeodactylibacter sp.]MCB9037970.1 acetylglutamate kinase [Lewinellaceae bacterium]